MGAFPRIANGLWEAELSLHGGQLLRCFHRDSPHPVIWLGSKASFSPGSSIRGGSPVCWPWFGASPVPGRPIQGFARQHEWRIRHHEKDFISMTLPEENVPPELRDFPFELSHEIRLSDALEMTLVMKNCGAAPVRITMALHTYFAVSDCEKVRVHGLEGTPYTVKGGPEEPGERGPLAVRGECCRMYLPQTGEITLEDEAWNRSLLISKTNSGSTLVWNPGEKRAAQIADLASGEYRQFLCIEANRAAGDFLELAPGETASVSRKIRIRVR